MEITERIFSYLNKLRKKKRNKWRSYNGQIIKSYQVKTWYDHFRKTGERLNVNKIEVKLEDVRHLLKSPNDL
jgi:hypothetical protein